METSWCTVRGCSHAPPPFSPQGCPLDPRPHHQGSGTHCCSPPGHPPGDGAHPADSAAEVLSASVSARCPHHRPAGLHGHHRQCAYLHLKLYQLFVKAAGLELEPFLWDLSNTSTRRSGTCSSKSASKPVPWSTPPKTTRTTDTGECREDTVLHRVVQCVLNTPPLPCVDTVPWL